MGNTPLRADPTAVYAFDGWLNDYLERITDQWIKVVPYSNPGILQIFRDRDRRPLRNIVAFAGEFPGKYLVGAVQVLRLTGDAGLQDVLTDFVSDLIDCQDTDGYLGPWPRRSRLTGRAPNSSSGDGWGVIGMPESQVTDDPDGDNSTWDTWGHYHIMMGLMLWADHTGDKKALRSARRIADLLCRTFLGTGRRMVDAGLRAETNLSPAHSLCLLYRATGTTRYLELAKQAVSEFDAGGDYVRTALAGMEFYETPLPRWESLHSVLALPEMYYITGDQKYRDAFGHIYWSLLKLDRHNNGGFSSGERARGNPYLSLPIETCCTVTWLAMSVEMLRLTANSIVADEIELSTLNSVVGMHSASGRWVTYDTPMDGLRRASAYAIVMHSREGTPELNCCSVNGHRGFGLISDWALMRDDECIILNYYGPSALGTTLTPGRKVTLVQETSYPVDGRIRIAVRPSRPTRFTLKLRVPYWSARPRIRVNGEPVRDVKAGTYCSLERTWKKGDLVDLSLDMSEHFWVGEQECRGLVSMYRGPILMTYDRRFNEVDPDNIAALDARTLKRRRVRWKGRIPPILLMEYRDEKGARLTLCDFGSAGEGGTPYRSWLKIKGVQAGGFSRENPLRSVRIEETR